MADAKFEDGAEQALSLKAETAEDLAVISALVQDAVLPELPGRSAAMFTVNFDPPLIESLALKSREFFLNPPEDFAPVPLMTPRERLWIARADQKRQKCCRADNAVCAGSSRRFCHIAARVFHS